MKNKVAQTSASWISGGFSQRQITPQAALSFGQPRPISRLGRSGRPYRPCFPHRYEAAEEAAGQAAGGDAKRAAQDAFLASLAQPRTRADSAKELLQTIKDAGVAGVISFGLVQLAC